MPEITRTRQFRTGAVVVLIIILLAVAGFYAVSGLVCNTFLWILLGAFLAWVVYRFRDEKWSEAKIVGVGLVVFFLFMAAMFPWQAWNAEQEEHYLSPVFEEHLSYSVIGEAHIVVDGYISNVGTGSGQATVKITAYGGYPNNDTEQFNMTGAFKEGYVSTGWIEPGGNSYIHWECYLSYFNPMGSVSWQIIDTTAT